MIQNNDVPVTQEIKREGSFYSGVLWFENKPIKATTFFPAQWSRQQVVEAIKEAYENFTQSGIPLVKQHDGKYLLKGVLKNNITIIMYIDKDATMVSAYPRL